MGDQASVYSRANRPSVLDEDGKLSSASAATALKYAKPQDLPSFPSTGGVKLSSASAAASLAASNQKSFEHWKPDPIPAANKAAMLAKDYTMQPLWQPESTKAGSKAANTAHANPQEIEPLQPKKSVTTNSSNPAYENSAGSRSKALMAANSVHSRSRAGSLPAQPHPKPQDASAWALQAATKSHKNGPTTASSTFSSGDAGFEAARIQNAAKDNASRQLYTSNPPVSIEVQEKNRQDMLKASAIAMARKMYAIQQQHIDEASGRAKPVGRGRSSTVGGSSQSVSDDYAASTSHYNNYENLEEAARRLAQERLAKIHDEHAEYRQYYGAQPTSPSKSRLSRLGRRASNNARDRDDDSDEEQSRKIRSQMSIFQSKLAEVDSKKRQQDRDALLVIAHRNVDAQISKLDEKIFQETGKASPAQMEKWERSAREKAQRESDERMQHTGKVHIGGGKYIDQSELDAIAKARLQPTLDDITEKAEKQRAKDEEERLEKLKKEQEAQIEKTRLATLAAETRAAAQRQKAEVKSARDSEKRGQKEAAAVEKQRRKDEQAAEKERERTEKEAQRERERLEKEEQRKLAPEKANRLTSLFSRGPNANAATAATATAGVTEFAEEDREEVDSSETSNSDDGNKERSTFHDLTTVPEGATSEQAATTAAETPLAETQLGSSAAERPSTDQSDVAGNRSSADEEKEGVTSPGKNRSRVKSWMRVRFRSKSGTQKEMMMPAVAEQSAGDSGDVKKEAEETPETTKDASRPESMRDVAMAGRNSHESDDLYGPPRAVSPQAEKSGEKAQGDRSASISSLSSNYSDEVKDVKPEEATIEEAKVVDMKPQATTDVSESEGDQRGKSGFKARLLKKISPNKSGSKDEKPAAPVTSNIANEEDEEARDTFEEEKLSPPQPLSNATEEGTGQKTLSPKTSREGSRFTENL